MPPPTTDLIQLLQLRFQAVLPRIETHLRIAFRGVRCPHHRDDLLQEATAVSWKWFRRAAERGKDPRRFVSRIATYAAAHIRSGRRFTRSLSSRDVLSPVAQRRHRFSVHPIPERIATVIDNEIADAIHEDAATPVPDQAAFRVDFPAWLGTLTPHRRRLVLDMACGERTDALAHRHGVSPGRVSQVRREAHASWVAFTEG